MPNGENLPAVKKVFSPPTPPVIVRVDISLTEAEARELTKHLGKQTKPTCYNLYRALTRQFGFDGDSDGRYVQ